MTKTLYVDLDGTLVRSDTLLESLYILLRESPHYLFLLPLWLLKGRAHFKEMISSRAEIEPDLLPIDKDFLSYLRRERAMGTRLILATAAHERIAKKVFDHIGLFESYLATKDGENLKGSKKLEKIKEQNPEFYYAGNHPVDLKIWKEAKGAVVVGPSSLKKKAEKLTEVISHFPPKRSSLKILIKGLRVHQWAKNLLLFLPLLLAHEYTNVEKLITTFWGWLFFSFVASSVYLLNDIVDIEADRAHPEKSKRPLASGEMPLHVGAALAVFTFFIGFIGAFAVSKTLFTMLLIYYVITTLYSFRLKKIALVDAFTLAGLFTWRIFAGGKVADVRITFWLMAFSMFFFLSLAFAKRAAELHTMKSLGRKKAKGRGYMVEDEASVKLLGAGSGIASIVILTLYVSQPTTLFLYSSPSILLGCCIAMLYWISRVWLKVDRGEMSEDPIAFALKDKASYLVVIAAAVFAYLARNY